MTLAQHGFSSATTPIPVRWSPPRARADAPRVEFIDVAFTASGTMSVIEAIEERPADAPFAYVVTPNVDHIVRLQHQRSDLWPAYRAAWMTLCDSRILARLARRVGFALPVVPGSDLTRQMFEQVVQPQDRIAILGGRSELIAQLSERYGLRNVRHYNPPMGFIHDPVEVTKAVRFLVDSGARYHFLAVGSPQQEILAYRVGRAGRATGVGLCVGASLDFLTGVQERAPLVMQRLGLEWLFRLGANPRRMWKRYLVDGPLIFPIEQRWRRDHAKP
ncbi:WecB/TagA/CpsF family glycosyltransferase [Sphingobium aromaticiconvertens]|uniref:WecB/TagA/CpsF family glycosyltransferase n=1 Tax=Sphingobium aromaticiconvertens TaxID=365341 RepID=UPI003017E02C